MAAASTSIASSANFFRRLTWQATIPLEIRLADNEPGAGSGNDRYYVYAPRYTYLPLLIPEIRENLVELILDDQQLAEMNEGEWWFEEDPAGGSEGSFALQGACKWHWPLDLIHLHSLISRPQPSDSSSSSGPSSTLPSPAKANWKPLRLVLHLSNPPKDQLLLPGSIEMCKTEYMNRMKEADLLRWRNTSRVTNMRRVDLDAGWDGIVQDDYDQYMRMASRLIPLPIPLTSQAPSPAPGVPPRPASTDPSGQKNPDSAYTARGVPIKIYLPDNAPVIQDIFQPISSSGEPATLITILRKSLPLLFPSPATDSAVPEPYPLAVPLAQGIQLPSESDLAWLSSCLCGADGWLRIGIQLKT